MTESPELTVVCERYKAKEYGHTGNTLDRQHDAMVLADAYLAAREKYDALLSTAKRAMETAVYNWGYTRHCDDWHAGWDRDVPHELWTDISTPMKSAKDIETESFDIAVLSETTDGWVVYDESGDTWKWIPMSEWLQILEARSKEQTT